MERAELRSRRTPLVHQLLRPVPLPAPWECNEFLDRLELVRGRDIDLLAVDWTCGESTGAWRRCADHDVIVYAANTSRVHQDHMRARTR